MFSLHLLTYQALPDELGNVPLHPIPPIVTLQVVVHLCSSRVHSISARMSLKQNPLSQLLYFWNTQSVSEVQASILSNDKIFHFSYQHLLTNLLKLFVSPLGLFDLLQKYGLRPHLRHQHSIIRN